MKRQKSKSLMALLLALIMVVGLIPATALAVEPGMLTDAVPEYNISAMPLVSEKVSTLAPGVTERKIVSYSTDGKRVELFVTVTDLSVETTKVVASYKNYQLDEKGGQRVTEQAAAYEAKNPGETVVAGINASYFEGADPLGAMVMNGVEMPNRNNDPNARPYFAILKDGTPYIGAAGTYNEMKDQIQEAVGGELLLINNGEPDYASADYRESEHTGWYQGLKYPRQTVGITEDGKVITMTADGRQSHSDGTIIEEQVAIMLALGCKWALHLDGGGSTTYAARPEGSDTFQVVNSPSDGFERAGANALLIVSTAAASDEFDRAVLTPANDYVTPNSTVAVEATGVSANGSSAEIPAGATWALEDPSFGTIADGVFTSTGKTGVAVVQMLVDGVVKGTANINVVIPETLAFTQANITVPYDRSIILNVVAKAGYHEVTLKDGDVTFTLADEGIGTLSSNLFTAASSEAATVTSTTVTATLNHGENITATANIALGRGSEIAIDFEDAAKNATLTGEAPYSVYGLGWEVSIVTAENGKVKNGQQALKVVADTAHSVAPGYLYTRVLGLDIDLTDAVSLSFWVYVPEGSFAHQVQLNDKNSGGGVVSLNQGYELEHGTGWHYVTVPVADFKGAPSVAKLYLYNYNLNSDYGAYPNYNSGTAFYFDDFTVNYSSAVDDNFAPIISDVMVVADGAEAALNGQTITTDTVSITARVADDTALGMPSGVDTDSVVVYVDGQKVDATCSGAGVISAEGLQLNNGTHIIRIEAADAEGNSTYAEGKIVIAKEGNDKNTIVYAPVNAELTNLPADSIYWTQLTATAIEKVEKIETVIELDQNSKWELDHMVLAEGFSATYSVDADNNDATIVITRTGEVTATGETVVAKLPIRVWFPEYDLAEYQPSRLMAVVSWVEAGLLVETDDNEVFFSSDEICAVTEFDENVIVANKGKTGCHIHTAEAVADQAATCTVNGWTDRTFCEECDSVVAWGTTIPATGHNYEVVEGVLLCTNTDCGKLFNGEFTDGKLYKDGALVQGWQNENTNYYKDGVKLTGIVKIEGLYYDLGEDGVNKGKVTGLFKDPASNNQYRYAIVGEGKTGWQLAGDNSEDWYYFDNNGLAVSGKQTVGGVEYEFEANGLVKDGVWVTTNEGTRYYYGPGYYKASGGSSYAKWRFFTIDGKEYCFGLDGYRLEGIQYVSKSNDGVWYWYDFGTDGVAKALTTSGTISHGGKLHLMIDGKTAYFGLIKYNGDFYYVNSKNVMATGEYAITKTNDLLPTGPYMFHEDGRMYQGVEDGAYYVNGRVVKNVGVIYDAEKKAYYYIGSTGAPSTGKLFVSETKANGLLLAGTYEFGTDGKLIGGLVPGADGKTYYYENGETVHAGLIYDSVVGCYYYVRTDGQIATGVYTIYKSRCNGLLPAGTYDFGAKGQLFLDGLVKAADGMYYFEDGKLAHAGLIYDEAEGCYYYIRTNGKAATGVYTIYKSRCNGLLPAGTYDFGADGKLFVDGLLKAADGVYYYQNGELTHAGLIYNAADDSFYYIRTSGKAATGVYTIYNSRCNGLLPAGTYDFGADGKLAATGLVKATDAVYYCEKGQLTHAGLVYDEAEGCFYYIRTSGKAATGVYTIYKSRCNGLLPAGTYDFGADGKLVVNGLVEAADGMYYYENGKPAHKGLIYDEAEGCYYYIRTNGKAATGEYTIYKSRCNGLLPAGTYDFGADGKLFVD